MRAELPVLAQPRLDLDVPDVGAAVAAAVLLPDPTRAAILRLLREGRTACARWRRRPANARTTSATTFGRLRDARLVRASRHETNGRFLYYERDEVAIRAACDALREILE